MSDQARKPKGSPASTGGEFDGTGNTGAGDLPTLSAPKDVKEGCRQYIKANRTPQEQELQEAITWDNEVRARQSYMESHGGWDQQDYNRSRGREPDAPLSQGDPTGPDFKPAKQPADA
jgi:hypothetical protein